MLRRWNREVVWAGLPWLRVAEVFTPWPVLAGALLGTLSHVLLDSLMHADMTPLVPWSTANPWLGLISGTAITVGCLAAGLLGLAGWFVDARLRGRRARPDVVTEQPHC